MNVKQISTMLGRLVEHMSEFVGLSTKDMQWVIQNTKEAIQIFVAGVKTRAIDSNPHEFFQSRKGLWVSKNSRIFILSVAETVLSSLSVKTKSFDLSKRMTDEEIRAELGDNHVWESASDFRSYLVGKINLQPNGGEGELLKNRYANIFYVRGKDNMVFTVVVYWRADDRSWLVNAYRLNGDRWHAGDRAFSCNIILYK